MTHSRSVQTALIVGASRGLGLGLTKEYLKRGWRVVATVRGSRPTALHDVMAQADGRTRDCLRRHRCAGSGRCTASALEGRAFDLLFVNAGVSNGPMKRSQMCRRSNSPASW